MTLSALDRVDDAYRATSGFLSPLDRTQWLKLALVGLFVGLPATNASAFQYNVPADQAPTGEVPIPAGPVDVPVAAWVALAVLVAVALVVGLGFLLVGSVMEFVLVESLRERAVEIRAYWRRYVRRGLRLFAFRVAVGLVTFLSVALLAGLVVLPLAFGDAGASVVFVALVLLPAFLALALLAALVGGFTTAFVVPVMMVDDCGVLAGWRRLWPTITGSWTEYLAYAVVAFVLGIAGSVLVGVVTAILVALLLVPVGVLAALAVGLFVLAEPLGVVAFVFLAVLFVLAAVAVAALVQVPVLAYLRYYALLVLGDTNEAFDLIPEQRAAVED